MLYINQKPMYRFFESIHFIRKSKVYHQRIRTGACKGEKNGNGDQV